MKLVTKTLIDHAAYIRAHAECKLLDLDKYRRDIRQEMKPNVKKSTCHDYVNKKGDTFVIA